MKTIRYGLMLLLGAAVGCVTVPASWQTTKPKPLPAAAQTVRPPVTADQVNEHNAHEQAEALRQELERDKADSKSESKSVSKSEDRG